MSFVSSTLQAISAIAHQRVQDILDLPPDEREERYRLDWKACYEASLRATGRESLAREQADRMERWTRMRVQARGRH